jgi:hypothetical protein
LEYNFWNDLLKSKLKKLGFYTQNEPSRKILTEFIRRCKLRSFNVIWKIGHDVYKDCIPYNLTLETIPYQVYYPDIEFYLTRNQSYRVLLEFSTIILGWNTEIPLYVLLWIVDWTVKNADKHHRQNIVMLEKLRNIIRTIHSNRITSS